MADDFSKYEKMRDKGATPEQVYQQAGQDGQDAITQIRLIRAVFALDLRQAKEVSVRAEGLAHSLDEFQEGIAAAIEDEKPRFASK